MPARGNPNGGAHFRDRTACSNGHEYVEGSWYLSAPNAMGYRKRECRVCRRNTQRKHVKTSEERERENRAAQIRRARARLSPEDFEVWEADIAAKWKKQQESRMAPWNQQAAKAPDEFGELNAQLDTTRGNCFGRTEWTDYDDPRFPDESTGRPMPTSEEAEAMCAECPVFAMCDRWAEREKPAWGVHSGKVWSDGKIVTR